MSENTDPIEEQVWQLVSEYLNTASPEELHIFVGQSNYDGNTKAIELLIDNPKMDKGTALMLFWMLGADYNARFNEEEIQESNEKLIRLIEKRFQEGFYTQNNIYYDPADGIMPPEEYSQLGPIKREIPKIMYLPVQGNQKVDIEDENYDEGLPLPLADKIFALYD